MAMWHDFMKTTLLIVATLLPLINPPVSALIAMGMVAHMTLQQRAELTARVTSNSVAIVGIAAGRRLRTVVLRYLHARAARGRRHDRGDGGMEAAAYV
jgi:small neutral amino acid transporter SnatA (MarC family)